MGRPRQLGPDDVVIEPDNYMRQLVIERIPEAELQDAQNAPDPVHVLLGDSMRAYREWRAVSHTFVIQSNGDGLLTILFERTVPG